MKTFIFIFILVIGFFFFLFSNSNTSQMKHSTQTAVNTLEDIEQQNNTQIDKSLKEYTLHAIPKPTAIPEDQTFDTIKNILKKSSGREYAPEITLTTRINSYLYTLKAKEEFKQQLALAFNLSYDDIDKVYKKNILVWDWVNQFKE